MVEDVNYESQDGREDQPNIDAYETLVFLFF